MSGINHIEFEQVFSSWYEPIRNFLYYKTGDIQAAEDLTQDTFLKVWEKREEIRLETVKPLLYKIAGNLFLNRRGHQMVQLKFAISYSPVTDGPGPDFEMEVKEFDERLQSAINGLDEKKRTVFLMNRVEKLTYNQIAENLGITVKAVEKRMEKALSFLKQRVEINL
jgi:RNA polymerase sigma-70 factor (ECF subfamily)